MARRRNRVHVVAAAHSGIILVFFNRIEFEINDCKRRLNSWDIPNLLDKFRNLNVALKQKIDR